MKHVIITAADHRCGDFLHRHWLRSLQENVCLDGIDVAVLDYGLTDAQRGSLEAKGLHLHPSRKDGHITNIRYRDLAVFLEHHNYDQVLAIDGGDIIFQADIRPLFERDKASFRVVCEQRSNPLHDLVLPRTDMPSEDYRRVFAFLDGKPQINGGVLFGPAEKFRTLWRRFQQLCHSFDVFGTDQLLMNYLLYQDGFKQLEIGYNFAIIGMTAPFQVKRGVFYDERGAIIPIVHNAGMRSIIRSIDNFGYGPDRNRRKRITPVFVKLGVSLLNHYKHIRRHWSDSAA